MTKRIAAIGILFWSSLILMLMAMGGLEWDKISFGQAYILSGISLALMGGAVVLSRA